MKSMLASLVLLPALALAAPEDPHVTYFATATGGLYGHGSVSQLVGDQRHVIYDFCPTEPCLDGAAPLSEVFLQPDGSVLGVTANGGSGARFNSFEPDGVVYRLIPGPHGSWDHTVQMNICGYWTDCPHFGYPLGVTSPKPGTLVITSQMRDGKKGERWKFKRREGGNVNTRLQAWGHGENDYAGFEISETRE